MPDCDEILGGGEEPKNVAIPCKHNFRSYAKNNAFK